jgi:hypothetical protein
VTYPSSAHPTNVLSGIPVDLPCIEALNLYLAAGVLSGTYAYVSRAGFYLAAGVLSGTYAHVSRLVTILHQAGLFTHPGIFASICCPHQCRRALNSSLLQYCSCLSTGWIKCRESNPASFREALYFLGMPSPSW